MKLAAFLEEYNHAPFTDEEVAFFAAKVEDDAALSFASKTFVEAKKLLDKELDRIGYIYG